MLIIHVHLFRSRKYVELPFWYMYSYPHWIKKLRSENYKEEAEQRRLIKWFYGIKKKGKINLDFLVHRFLISRVAPPSPLLGLWSEHVWITLGELKLPEVWICSMIRNTTLNAVYSFNMLNVRGKSSLSFPSSYQRNC